MLDELLMGPLLDHASVVEDHDPLRQVQCRAAMRNEDRGSSGHDRTQGVVDLFFDPHVDRARRVIENKHSRVVQDGSRESDALALTPRQREPRARRRRCRTLAAASQ